MCSVLTMCVTELDFFMRVGGAGGVGGARLLLSLFVCVVVSPRALVAFVIPGLPGLGSRDCWSRVVSASGFCFVRRLTCPGRGCVPSGC